MNDSIFTKIIKGEIPAHKIYEDDKTIAFLDIHPETPGHTLVVPKIQVDKIYDLPDEYYTAVWDTARKVAKKLEEVNAVRSRISVVGADLPEHAHIHVFSLDPANSPATQPKQADNADLTEIAEKLKFK